MKQFLSFLLLLAAQSVYAEGRCPPGYFPQGGAGWQGCAPGPAINSAQAEIAVPDGFWKKTWGAIANSSNPPLGATVTGFFSEQEAMEAAVAECRKKGGKDCEGTYSYFNRCLAIAQIPTGGIENRVAAESIKHASELAMAGCKDKNPGQVCAVVVSECTEPVYRPY